VESSHTAKRRSNAVYLLPAALGPAGLADASHAERLACAAVALRGGILDVIQSVADGWGLDTGELIAVLNRGATWNTQSSRTGR
jgi:hypothetical protein